MKAIKVKQIGQNLIMTVDGIEKPLSRKIVDKVERDIITESVKDYAVNPSDEKFDAIVASMTVNTEVKKDVAKKVGDVKGVASTASVDKVVTEESKKISDEEKKALVNEVKKEQEKPKPVARTGYFGSRE